MFDIPLAAVHAAQFMGAQSTLRRTLEREPTTNEVLRFLCWPEKVGEVVVKPCFYQVGGGTAARIPETSLTIHLEKTPEGDIRVSLTDSGYLKDLPKEAASRG